MEDSHDANNSNSGIYLIMHLLAALIKFDYVLCMPGGESSSELGV